MTDLNTLKNWFKTGLKPTQKQFAAWMDSFWHKSEKIPQSSIDGLDTTLGNKADADQLKNKADLVAGKIPLAQMPFADDVLEFPAQSNFPAKGEVGKIYLDLAADKPFVWDAESAAYKPAGGDDVRMAQMEQNLASEITNRTNADAGKVDKPTADGNWVLNKLGAVFSWVDASNFGKNVANTFLDTVANAGVNLKANWKIATGGYSFSVEGLSDKSTDPKFCQVPVLDSNGVMAKSNGKPVIEGLLAAIPLNKDAAGNYDNSFSEYLVRNPTTGLIKRSDRPQVQSTFNVPGTINVGYSTKIANSNYTPAPTTPQDVADTFNMIKNLETGYQFTAITPDMLVLRTMDAAKISPYSTWRVPTDINKTVDAGTIVLKGFNPDYALVSNASFRAGVSTNENSLWTLFINKEFPTDKDWILKMKLFPEPGAEGEIILNMRGFYMGFAESVTATTQSSKQTDLRMYPDSALLYPAGVGKYTTIYFIKKGSKLSAFYYNSLSGNMMVNTIDFDNSMKFFRMATMIENQQGVNKGLLYSTYFTEVAYWVQP